MSRPAAFAPSSGISRQARFVVSYQKRNEQVKGKDMIQWPCRQCGEELEVPESLGSDSIECPSCGVSSRPPDDSAYSSPKEAGSSPTESPKKYPMRAPMSDQPNHIETMHRATIILCWVIPLVGWIMAGVFWPQWTPEQQKRVLEHIVWPVVIVIVLIVVFKDVPL